MKHPVLGVLSIFSISVYAASIPDYVENTPLLVKRQVYPEDPSTDSMYQSQNPEGGPFDPSSPQLGMMPPNVDPFTQNIYGDPGSNTGPFSGEQGGASHSFNEPGLSDYTTRFMPGAPSNNGPDIQFGGQPEQQLEEAYSSDAITVGGKARISPCPDGSIPKGPNFKCYNDAHVLSKIVEGKEAGNRINSLFVRATKTKLKLKKIVKHSKMCKEHIAKLEAQKAGQLDANGSARLQSAIDASVTGCRSKAARAEELIKEIQDDMEKVEEAYNRQRTSYEEAKDIFISIIPSATLSSFGLDGDIRRRL
ncbi:hypothetical protein BASA50_007575 [Batrachochytrium salamandrivorans]|uniref:Uncharacterized protein n=1 Tax=Batrachochytrium salamandrivorans TaxID=1357716 RepID=A0ABQ8F6J7_9FUNG|nr:hypothetical protein BASA50_007575 [Batrachochytrium salamandrivorans]KAH9269506.1 hypothetical protein BASA83_008456 [Batrachochytrium salamandrivorans]